MKFTEEQLKKMNAAKTAEELSTVTDMRNEREIADDELANVAGGVVKSDMNPKHGQPREGC